MAKTQLTGNQIKDADITASDIADGAVTLEKLADMATASVLGRNTPGVGSPEVIPISTFVSMLTSSSGAFQRNLSGDLVLADGESLIASGYINTNGHDLILSGDAQVEVL